MMSFSRFGAGQSSAGWGTWGPSTRWRPVFCRSRSARRPSCRSCSRWARRAIAAGSSLGVQTTTYDGEGEVTASREGPWPGIDVIEKALDRFRGEIMQVPPPYSAVKRDGEAAYRKARRGETVALEPRPVTLYRLEVLSYEAPELELEVDCSAGTYLRSLAHDLGGELGTFAYLRQLIRTRSGPFTLEQAVPWTPSTASRIIPMAAATGLPSFDVDARTARRVGRGDPDGAPRGEGRSPRGNAAAGPQRPAGRAAGGDARGCLSCAPSGFSLKGRRLRAKASIATEIDCCYTHREFRGSFARHRPQTRARRRIRPRKFGHRFTRGPGRTHHERSPLSDRALAVSQEGSSFATRIVAPRKSATRSIGLPEEKG